MKKGRGRMGMKVREGKERNYRKQRGKERSWVNRRGTWEGIKNGVCVPYCENALLPTI